jgi:hypothetical protein
MKESENWTTSVVNADPVLRRVTIPDPEGSGQTNQETAPLANATEPGPETSTLEPLPPDGNVEGERAKELEYLKDQPLRIPQENSTSSGDYIPKSLKSEEISLAAVIRVEADERTFSFMPVDTSKLPPLGSQPPATRILIPAIDVLAPVVPLDLVKDQKGHWSYVAPWREIGRIDTAGNPGEKARGWYFGHLRLRIANLREDGTFWRLPEIVDFLAQGKPVNIILETQQAAYLYQVLERPIVLTALEFDNGYFQDHIYAAQPEIVLATCVSALKPDHRLLVVARLVGVGHSP